MISRSLELLVKTLFPLFLLAASPFLHAESLLFASIGTDSNEDHSALTAYCSGNPDRDNVLECRFIQQSIEEGLSRSAIEEKKAKLLEEFRALSDKEKDLSSLCSDVLKPLSPQLKEKLKNSYAAESVQDLRKVCSSPDRAEAFKALALKGLDAEAGRCLVLPPTEWKSKFVRKDATTFTTEPSSGGQCGAVAVETLQREAPNRSLWSYTVQRAYFDRTGDLCSTMPEKVTMKFAWNAERTFRSNCKVLSFGRFR